MYNYVSPSSYTDRDSIALSLLIIIIISNNSSGLSRDHLVPCHDNDSRHYHLHHQHHQNHHHHPTIISHHHQLTSNHLYTNAKEKVNNVLGFYCDQIEVSRAPGDLSLYCKQHYICSLWLLYLRLLQRCRDQLPWQRIITVTSQTTYYTVLYPFNAILYLSHVDRCIYVYIFSSFNAMIKYNCNLSVSRLEDTSLIP